MQKGFGSVSQPVWVVEGSSEGGGGDLDVVYHEGGDAQSHLGLGEMHRCIGEAWAKATAFFYQSSYCSIELGYVLVGVGSHHHRVCDGWSDAGLDEV